MNINQVEKPSQNYVENHAFGPNTIDFQHKNM